MNSSFFLQLVQQELDRALSPIKLTASNISKLEFQPTIYQSQHRLWIHALDHLGVWFDKDGHGVELVLVTDQVYHREHFLPVATFALGVCLTLQGQIALHANGVGFGGGALGFVGDSGQGKSTLTAHALLQGTQLLTDDVLIVDEQAMAQPGYPRLKLLPETSAQLGLTALQLQGLKMHYQPEHLGAHLQLSPLPLKGLFLLDGSDDGTITAESVPPSQAVFELLSHSYHTVLSNFLVDAGQPPLPEDQVLLDAYIRLVSQVPVRRLRYPRDFMRLPEVFALVVSHL